MTSPSSQGRGPGRSTPTTSTSRPVPRSPPHAFEGAGLIVSVNALDAPAVRQLAEGTATLSFVHTNQAPELVADLRDCGITAFAMELVPRISRAQSMDALSSQALVAGYRSAIVAAGMLRRFFPLNMTAAGTVPPAAGRRARRRRRRAAGDRDRQAARCGGQGLRRPRRLGRGDPVAGRGRHRPGAGDPRGHRRLRPRDDRRPRRHPAREADAVHRRRRTRSSPPPRCRAAPRRCWSPPTWSSG